MLVSALIQDLFEMKAALLPYSIFSFPKTHRHSLTVQQIANFVHINLEIRHLKETKRKEFALVKRKKCEQKGNRKNISGRTHHV